MLHQTFPSLLKLLRARPWGHESADVPMYARPLFAELAEKCDLRLGGRATVRLFCILLRMLAR